MGTFRLTLPVLGLFIHAGVANAMEIAVCGNSTGQAYYPRAGLRTNEPSLWTDDPITAGRLTLSMSATGDFDILFGDATGAVISATQDGAKVLVVGQNDISISVLVVYPMLVETYTFLHSNDGPEVMWTTNKHSTPVLKAGAYRAACTFINLPPA